VHPNVGPHAAQSVALVTADRAPEGLDALMGVHVTLGGTGRGTDGSADRASPAAGRTGDASVIATGFYYRLRQTIISRCRAINPPNNQDYRKSRIVLKVKTSKRRL